MPFNFEAIVGSHEKALYMGARRTKILAANIANADTPGYKARDLDFKAAFNKASNATAPLKTTSQYHIQPAGLTMAGGEVLYRVPSQPSLDGNTVDTQIEQAKFAENAVRYQTTLRFLGGRFKGIINALRDE
jgi:flagellar basal-body rod protein FlgB